MNKHIYQTFSIFIYQCLMSPYINNRYFHEFRVQFIIICLVFNLFHVRTLFIKTFELSIHMDSTFKMNNYIITNEFIYQPSSILVSYQLVLPCIT